MSSPHGVQMNNEEKLTLGTGVGGIIGVGAGVATLMTLSLVVKDANKDLPHPLFGLLAIFAIGIVGAAIGCSVAIPFLSRHQEQLRQQVGSSDSTDQSPTIILG